MSARTLRLSGIILPPNKHIRIALRGIYGIGNARALAICEKIGVNPSVRVADLEESHASLLQEAVNHYEVEGDLRRRVSMDIKRLGDIKCYRGLRHKRGLPVRGQRTRTNARTRKGRKRQASGGSMAKQAQATK